MFLAGIWGRFSNPDFCCSNKMSIGNLLDREKKDRPQILVREKRTVPKFHRCVTLAFISFVLPTFQKFSPK